MIATESVDYGAAASDSTDDVLEMQNPRPGLDLLNKNQHFHKIPRCYLCILKSENTWSRE